MGLDAKIKLTLEVTNVKDSVDLSNPTEAFTYEKQFGFANGVSANQADQIWHDQRVLAPTTAEDLDIKGSLTDVFGAAFTPAKLKAIIVAKVGSTGGPIRLFGQATNGIVNVVGAAADFIDVDDMAIMVNRTLAGWAVTAGTADLLQVNNTHASEQLTYDIFLIGASS